jgi:hypothetical protein
MIAVSLRRFLKSLEHRTILRKKVLPLSSLLEKLTIAASIPAMDGETNNANRLCALITILERGKDLER